MAHKYRVWGDYGYVSETLLEEFQTAEEGIRWVNGYVASGDFGGYNIIEVAYIDARTGEYCVVHRVDAPSEEMLYDEF